MFAQDSQDVYLKSNVDNLSFKLHQTAKNIISNPPIKPNGLLLLPPSAFFIIALFIVIIRTWKPEQVEDAEFVMKPQSKGMAHGGGH